MLVLIAMKHPTNPIGDSRCKLDFASLRNQVVGADATVTTPFGDRLMVYADYTASGRSLSFIEDYLRDVVLPLYANTHTESSGTGLQTTRFREEARQMIRSSLNANEEHAVVFTGSGATSAIDRLIAVLGLRIPSTLEDQYHFGGQIPESERPVVFIGPFEHHSNELPWRESRDPYRIWISEVMRVTAAERRAPGSRCFFLLPGVKRLALGPRRDAASKAACQPMARDRSPTHFPRSR